MNIQNQQERIVSMHQMLFEMARGNFDSRIPLNSSDDELETLVVLINMVAEEMKESKLHYGYVSAQHSQQFIAQACFVLDSSFYIKSFTPEVISYLGYSESDLLEQPLACFLSEASFQQLNEVMHGSISVPTTIALEFKTKEDLVVSVPCSLGKLMNRSEILLNLVTPVRQDLYCPIFAGKDTDKQVKNRKSEAILIQKLYDYILANLEKPLPSLKELSREFGTNEYTLKNGFRHFFKTSIYQFYNDERLKRAYFMIEHTPLPLKSISIMNGFSTYPNFSKSFKKRFGFSPYDLKRTGVSFTSPLEE